MDEKIKKLKKDKSHKFIVKYLSSDGIKQNVINSNIENLNKDKIKEYFRKKYEIQIAILEFEKTIDTKLVSGIYEEINEN